MPADPACPPADDNNKNNNTNTSDCWLFPGVGGFSAPDLSAWAVDLFENSFVRNTFSWEFNWTPSIGPILDVDFFKARPVWAVDFFQNSFVRHKLIWEFNCTPHICLRMLHAINVFENSVVPRASARFWMLIFCPLRGPLRCFSKSSNNANKSGIFVVLFFCCQPRGSRIKNIFSFFRLAPVVYHISNMIPVLHHEFM